MTTPGSRSPLDVVSLVFGLLMVAVAGTALWHSVTGSLDWTVVKTAAPLVLVAVGTLGLVLTRR